MRQVAPSGFSFHVFRVFRGPVSTKSLTQRRKDAKDLHDPKSSRWQSSDRLRYLCVLCAFACDLFLVSPLTEMNGKKMQGKKSSREDVRIDHFFAPHFFALPEPWLRLTAAPSSQRPLRFNSSVGSIIDCATHAFARRRTGTFSVLPFSVLSSRLVPAHGRAKVSAFKFCQADSAACPL